MDKTLMQLQPYLEKNMAFTTALALLEWDNETLAPKEAIGNTSRAIGILSDEQFKAIINDKVKNILEKLESEKENKKLEDSEKALIKQLRKTYNKLEAIPPEEYKEFCEFQASTPSVWAKAKEHNSFEEFASSLKKMIEYKKNFTRYRQKQQEEPYDILLEDYEEGVTMKVLDEFFGKIKEEIIPLLKEVVKKNHQIDKSYNFLSYDIEKQKEFCKWISSYVGFDYNKGVLAESEHPFTTNLHNKDVRITNHYEEFNLEGPIFSVIHETGHAIYEFQIADELTQSMLGTAVSMGMHESQSRFFENVIGKSYEFWKPIYGRLKDTFPEQLSSIPLEQFIKGINKVEPGRIRIDADELTYAFHIMIRYEIEKLIFQGKAKVKELPDIWNQKYEEYLGVKPSSDSEGILQDIHWACGDFGYFPSYAIGNAIAAQLYAHMRSVMPFDKYLLEGNLSPIVDYLRDNIHQFGAAKNMNEILLGMMNEGLNVDYYITYLKEKYSKVYNL